MPQSLARHFVTSARPPAACDSKTERWMASFTILVLEV
ncbi:hypothetical protein J2857_003526 [Neorhizobium galegae]|nr:hypothetical protein [Neorhizobium galegae]